MTPSDDEIRKLWRAAGGWLHGPHVETGGMPESMLLPFLRKLLLDARRYRWLRETTRISAQAMFWNYESRKERDKAIDKAIRATHAKD